MRFTKHDVCSLTPYGECLPTPALYNSDSFVYSLLPLLSHRYQMTHFSLSMQALVRLFSPPKVSFPLAQI